MDGVKDYQEIVRRLMMLSDVGIVNAKADTQLIRDAAMLIDVQAMKIDAMEERIYEMEERIAIMEEGDALSGPCRPALSLQEARVSDGNPRIAHPQPRCARRLSGQLPQRGSQVSIEPGANVDLWPILDSIEKKSSGLIEEE